MEGASCSPPDPERFRDGPRVALSVGQFTRHVRAVLEADDLLADVWVRGEVGRVSRPGSGHLYFGLKDADSQVPCVLWRSDARSVAFLPETGVAVIVHGRATVYEPRGYYQLVVDAIEPAGVGALYEAFEQLRARLAAEGLFDETRKRPLPACPRRVALVTSPTGAAVRDLVTVLRRVAFPPAILIVPALVQGEGAPLSLEAALHTANVHTDVDLIIIGRGGGSLEDLWAFNTEPVVRAIAASRLPVISAVGHEIDFTLADFAADARAPTPTAAAEIVCRLREEAAMRTGELLDRARRALGDSLLRRRYQMEGLLRRRPFLWPMERVARPRQALDELTGRLYRAPAAQVRECRHRFALVERHLRSLAPQAILQRGYARVERRPSGEPVTRAAQLASGAAVRVDFLDGGVAAQVTDVAAPKKPA
ncbi:MAG: exodeoxyribonuclease VII large subunit [Armatimonadetes bacterium]|nr:exodeoxyribonuclease VII large subunit [Armatimonadota bacterium]